MCQQSANKMPLDLNASAASLKSRGIKGSLYEARGSFYWRVCVTDSEGQRKTRKIPLRLRAQPSTLTLAETRIAELSALILLKGFLPDQLPWDAPKVAPEIKKETINVAEAVKALEVDFWKGKIRTTAAEHLGTVESRDRSAAAASRAHHGSACGSR